MVGSVIKSSGYFTFLRRQTPATGFNGIYTGYSVGGFSTADKFLISASVAPDISQLGGTGSYEGVVAVVWKKNVTGSFVRDFIVPTRLSSGISGFATQITDQLAASTGSSDARGNMQQVNSGSTFINGAPINRSKVSNLPLSMSIDMIHRTAFSWKNKFMYVIHNGKMVDYKTLYTGGDNLTAIYPYLTATANWEIRAGSGATPVSPDQWRLIAISFDGTSGRSPKDLWEWDQQVKHTGNHQLSGAQYHWEANDWVSTGTGSWTDRIAGLQMLKGGAPAIRSESMTYEDSFEWDPYTHWSGSIVFAYDISKSGSYELDGSGNVQKVIDWSGFGNHLTGSSDVRLPRIAGVEYSPGLVFDGVDDFLFISGVNYNITSSHMSESWLTLTAHQLISGTSTNFWYSVEDTTQRQHFEMLNSPPARLYNRDRHWGSGTLANLAQSIGPYTVPDSGSWGTALLTQLRWDLPTKTLSGSAQRFNVNTLLGATNTLVGPAASGTKITIGNGGAIQFGAYTSMSLGAHFGIKSTSSYDDYINFQAWSARKGWI